MNRALRLATILALLLGWEGAARLCGDPTWLGGWWLVLGGDPRLAAAIGAGLFELAMIGGFMLVVVAAVAFRRRRRASVGRRALAPNLIGAAFGGLRWASTLTLLGAYTQVFVLAMLAIAVDELSERLLAEPTNALLRYPGHEKQRFQNGYRWSRWRDHR